MTNFDKLTLEIITNGAVDPDFALKEASKVLVDHYNAIIADENFELELTEPFKKIEPEEAIVADEAGEEVLDAISDGEIDGKTSIEDANLSQRTSNALLNAGVKTVAGLRRLSPLKLEEIKGLGKKGIEEIKEKLS
jgi:DNA-directed RNA polymerase subunit alpha